MAYWSTRSAEDDRILANTSSAPVQPIDRSDWLSGSNLGAGAAPLLVCSVAILAVFTLGLMALGQAQWLGLLFPGLALTLGLMLLATSPASYLGFTLSLWLVTPEVRRLMDEQVGWNPTNLIMVTPYLVTVVSAIVIFRYFRHAPRYQLLSFSLIFAGLFIGYGVGVLHVGAAAATYGLLDWAAAPILACYIVVNWRVQPELSRMVSAVAVVALVALGAYSLLQFLALPPWDAYWLANTPVATSIVIAGTAQVRAFATLNSPGPFAVVTMILLLVVASRSNRGKLLAIPFGGLALALSLVRSAWLGLAIGLLILLRRSRRSFVAVLLGATLITSVTVLVTPVRSALEQRLQTAGSISIDYSLQSRVQFYTGILGQVLTSPLGSGIGATGTATKLSSDDGTLGLFGNFDSGLLEIPFVLGWFGAALFAGGLLALLRSALKAGEISQSADASRATDFSRAVIFALLSQLLFVNVLRGVSGLFAWLAIGLVLASHAHGDMILGRSARLWGEVK